MYPNRQQLQQREAERAEKKRIIEKLNRDMLEQINVIIENNSEQIEELRRKGMKDEEIDRFLTNFSRDMQVEMIAKFKAGLRAEVFARHEQELQAIAPR